MKYSKFIATPPLFLRKKVQTLFSIMADKKNKTKKRPSKTTYFPASFWRTHAIAALILMLAGFGLYAISLNFDYVLDDKIVYTDNDLVKKGFAGIGPIFSTESFQGYFGEQKDLVEGGRYRPLSLVTFAMEFALFGQKEWVSHLINVILYVLTGLLLFRVLFLFFPNKKEETDLIDSLFSLPFIAALLFVLHPIHTEVVANVKGRDEILCLLGGLAAIYCLFRYYVQDKNGFLWFGIGVLSLLLALFGKENAITFVGVIPLSLYFFAKLDVKKLSISTAGLIGVFVVWFMIRSQVLGFAFTSGTEVTDLMNNPFYGMNVGEKFATIFHTLGLYVKLLFFPHPLTHDYYPYHIPIMQWSDWQVILSLIVNLAIVGVAIWGFLKKNVWGYASLFYLMTLSITSNLPFTIGTFMNERFVYISSVGVCIALAYLFHTVLTKKMARPIVMGLLGLYAIGFIVKTATRVPDWQSEYTLNEAAIKISKNSARANLFWGSALFKRYQAETDHEIRKPILAEATYHIDRALEINPRYGSAITMKSGTAAENYRYDKDLDKLLASFSQVLRTKYNVPYVDTYMEYLNPRAPQDKLINWYYQTAMYFKDTARRNDLAAKYFKMGLQVAPNNPQLRQGLQMVE